MNTGSESSLFQRVWRAVRRLVFVGVALVVLVALFYLVENWRGHRAWQNHKAELIARGERLKPSDYATKPVPAEENFTQTPTLRAISYRDHMDKKLFSKFEAVKGFQEYWPIGTNSVPQEKAADVLAAFQGIEAEMAELRTAAKRRYAQFPKTNDNAFLAESPNFIMLRTLTQLFTIHASAELALGHAEQAREDLVVVQRLADSLSGNTTLVEAMIRVALLGITLRPFEQGLTAGAWSDEQLLAFQKTFESEQLLTALDAALRGGERNSITHLVAEMPRERLTATLAGNGVYDMKRYLFDFAVRWCPQGWLELNAVNYSRVMQKQLEIFDAKQQRVFPAKCHAADALIDEEVRGMNPYKYLVAVGVPNFSKAIQVAAERQTSLHEAALACALERYRRAHGEYPETLTALVPQFTTHVPTDLMTGGELKYLRPEKDKFLLYSVGWNLEDDHGLASKDRATGDWAWPPVAM